VGAVLRLEDEVKRVVWRFSKQRLKPFIFYPLNAEYNEVETLNPSGLVSIENFSANVYFILITQIKKLGFEIFIIQITLLHLMCE